MRSGALVYGADDRVEYFDVAPADRRALIAEAVVALIPKTSIRRDRGRVVIDAPTWGARDGLCPGERFADQPAAAFCTGVLVDWDLVLTAGHCVRLLAPQDFAVVFDYYYGAPGVVSVGPDVLDPVAIVSEALDPAGVDPRFDYAWLRLDRAAPQGRKPVQIHVVPPALAPGDPLISIGAGGSVPIKLDDGGRVQDARAPFIDYFVADTDTTEGSSGGGAFDQQLVLTGILSRGDDDLEATDAGCNVIVRRPDGADAGEQFTYAHRAVEGLCRQGESVSSICRPDCGEPCEALPRPPDAGCSVVPRRNPALEVILFLTLIGVSSSSRRLFRFLGNRPNKRGLRRHRRPG